MPVTKEKIVDVFKTYSIKYWTSGKNVGNNAVAIQCPYCDDHSNHLSVFFPTGLYSCWKCGKKGSFDYLLSYMVGMTSQEYADLIGDIVCDYKQTAEDQIKALRVAKSNDLKSQSVTSMELPQYCVKITEKTNNELLNRYLTRRKIKLETVIHYGCYLCEAGPFVHRLIIPVYYGGKIVQYQGADMKLHRGDLKYKSGVGNINDYLYNYDNIQNIMIITEGVLDCWRVGDDAVCTFGTHLTDKQRKLILKKNLSELIFCWDSDAWDKALEQSDYFSPFIPRITVVKLPQGQDPNSFGTLNTWEKIYNTEARYE